MLVLAGIDLLRVRNDVDAGREALSDLRAEDIESSGGVKALATQVQRRLESAADRAESSPWLRVLSPIPVVGDQISAVRDLSSSLSDLGDVALESGTAIDEALDGAGSPLGRLELFDVAMDELGRIEDGLAELDVDPPDRLLPPLRSAYDALDRAVASGKRKLRDGRELLTAAQTVLTGPNRYLVLAGNNAEMTAGSGMPLSVGVAEIGGGDIKLGEFVQSSDVVLHPDRWVPTGELGALYGLMGIGGDFRGTTATPNFPTTAPIFQEMAARSPLGPVDGVLLIDALALGELIALTGPVTVDGTEYSEANLVEELLHGNYVKFGQSDPSTRIQRAGLQANIAKAIFDSLTTRDIPLVSLVDRLSAAAKGRHLLAWSPDEDVQDLWDTIGATGELDPDGLMISFENYDGNKLDWFLRPSAKIDVGVTPDGDWQVTLEVSITNPVLDPAVEGDVVLGPAPEVHFVLLDLHLPEAAFDVGTTHVEGFRGIGKDPPMQARTMLFPVYQGTTEVRTILFSLPREDFVMTLLPSARVVPLPVVVDQVATINDAAPTPFSWVAAFPPSTDGSAPPAVRWLVIVAVLALLVAAVATTLLARRPDDPRPRVVAVAELSALLCLVALVVAAAIAIVLHFGSF